MTSIKKMLATTALAYITTTTTPIASANLIVNYVIAPQNMVTSNNNILAGNTWGTFTADFTTQQLTDVNMFISITDDIVYQFNTPQSFGSFTDVIFPDVTYYEANLATNTLGIWASTYFMNFLQHNTTQLFRGNTHLVFTSFGAGNFILDIVTVPEPSPLWLSILGIFAAPRLRKFKTPNIFERIRQGGYYPDKRPNA